jgi:hypothetical protein
MHLLNCDDNEGNLVHELVHWIATDPRTKPKILQGSEKNVSCQVFEFDLSRTERQRFHPESDLNDESIMEFIGQVLGTTQSVLSCLANISRVQPLLTGVVAELVVFYQV